MNDSNQTPVLPGISPTTDNAPTPIRSLEAYVRQHPASALIAAAGLGLAVVIIARALTPDPPQSRALRLLEDIQQRLSSAYDHAAHLADESSHAMGKGVDAMHLDRRLGKLSRGFRSLFH
jgi:hypothetical protein